MDRVLQAQEKADAGGLAQGRRTCVVCGGEAAEAEELGCWCPGVLCQGVGNLSENRWRTQADYHWESHDWWAVCNDPFSSHRRMGGRGGKASETGDDSSSPAEGRFFWGHLES